MAEIGRNLSREADKVVRAWQGEAEPAWMIMRGVWVLKGTMLVDVIYLFSETRAKGQALLQELANLGIGGG